MEIKMLDIKTLANFHKTVINLLKMRLQVR